MLFVSHDLAVIRQISHEVAVMYLGRIVEHAPAAALFERPLHPYTVALMSAIPIPDPEVEVTRRRIILAGDVPSAGEEIAGCRFASRCWLRAQLGNPERCTAEEPALADFEPGHAVACHFPESIRTSGGAEAPAVAGLH
jgi:oligopeptide/dipeptide ABC transporter ATP-binding protein